MSVCALKAGTAAAALSRDLRVSQPCSSSSLPARKFVPLRTLIQSSKSARAVQARVAVKEADVNSAAKSIEEKEEKVLPEEGEGTVPNAFEIQNMLLEICDETSIAEIKLKVGSFSLHVKRDLPGKTKKQEPVFYAPPVPSFPMAESIAAAGPAAAAPAAPAAPGGPVDEGLLYVTAPTVGILRRGRIFKGKRGRDLVAVGAEVKRGQVVCYVEQLGTQLAVESEHAGEVVEYLANDGDPIGFADHLIAIRPSFPGIKKLA